MNLSGKIITILANFYYVKDEENKIWECFARGRLIKEGKHLFVGDNVSIETTSDKQGVITDILARKNKVEKPPVANIDQVLVVFSTCNPEFDFYNLDRYLSFISYELPEEKILICMNKVDLKKIDLSSVYQNSGYEIIYVSALAKEGLDELGKKLVNKTTVLTGPSGVGKSSLINALKPELDLRVGPLSSINKGKQTTRNVQLIPVDFGNESGYLVDTPGFSQFSFTSLDPYKILSSFKEVNNIGCEFDNCLHVGEEGCSLKNQKDIPESRASSYLSIIEESKEDVVYGNKSESKLKSTGGNIGKNKFLPKINLEMRSKSRKKEKQEISKLEKDENNEY